MQNAGTLYRDLKAERSGAMTRDQPSTAIQLDPGWIKRWLILVVPAFMALCLAAHVLRFGFGLESAGGFVTMFDMDQEYNLPTWFSMMMMVAIAISLGLIAAASRAAGGEWTRHWAVLGVIFALMSMDESIQIHERFIAPLRDTLGLGGLLTNAWVLLAFVFLIFLAVFYARFVFSLPPRSRLLFIIAGTVYVTGVAGVEMVSGLMKSEQGMESLAFALSTTVEETMEMTGLAIFIYALADYMARQRLSWRIVAQQGS